MDTTLQPYFDVLPIHPRPEPLESLTGYLIRLAEVNGILNRRNLNAICFPNQESRVTSSMADYPPVSLGNLTQVSLCSEAEISNMTFYHVAKRFGRSTLPQAVSRFLNGTIAKGFRYCPNCIAERGYYLMPWRFIVLRGCPEHGSQLLDCCCHCGAKIPVFPKLLKVGICPQCRGDLRTCPAEEMDNQELQLTKVRFQDLGFLLSSQQKELAQGGTFESVGRQFRQVRQSLNIEVKDAARAIKGNLEYVNGLERGDLHKGIKFLDYLLYAELFGVTLTYVLNTALTEETNTQDGRKRRRAYSIGEEDLFQKVDVVLRNLESSGTHATLRSIAAEVGVSPDSLKYYPRVNEILSSFFERERISREDKMVVCFQQAVKNLQVYGRAITWESVCDIVGMSRSGLIRYEKIVQLWRQLQERHLIGRPKYARENELAGKTLEAVQTLQSRGEKVTLRGIFKIVGMSKSGLSRYPKVQIILKGVVPQRPNNPGEREARERELMPRLGEIAKELESSSQPITPKSIAKGTGMSEYALRNYPQINAELGMIIKRHRRSEDSILEQAEKAVEELKSLGQPVTYESIAKGIGMRPNSLPYYPKVRALRKRIEAERLAQREAELAARVKESIKELKAEGETITLAAISKKLLVAQSTLARNEQIKAMLECLPRQQVRTEDQLVVQVQKTIARLSSRGKTITQTAISREVGMSAAAMKKHPRVRVILARATRSRRKKAMKPDSSVPQ